MPFCILLDTHTCHHSDWAFSVVMTLFYLLPEYFQRVCENFNNLTCSFCLFKTYKHHGALIFPTFILDVSKLHNFFFSFNIDSNIYSHEGFFLFACSSYEHDRGINSIYTVNIFSVSILRCAGCVIQISIRLIRCAWLLERIYGYCFSM